jgi:hypothetical protein
VTEKRRFERISTALETRYTKSQGIVTISALSNTKNISLNGLCSKLSRTVRAKDTILVEVKLIGKVKIAVLAKIVWAKATPDKCSNLCGLKFLWVSSQEMLDKHIEKIGKQAAA